MARKRRRQDSYVTPRHASTTSTMQTQAVEHRHVPVLVIVLIIVLVVCLGVGLGILLAMRGPHSLARERSAEQAARVEQVSPEAPTEPTPAPAAEPAPDPRDAEFAVDPARTDWNFDRVVATPTVYLTFDDGPSENTNAVLDILDAYGIKATFFVTGINPAYADMIAECYHRGHTIGLHTYSHFYDQVYSSTGAWWADLDAIGSLVASKIGYVPCFIRFAGGSSNTISSDFTPGIMAQLADEVQAAGYQYFDWDASCGDGAQHTADELVDATIADTEGGLSSVCFLMHDGTGKETTVEALPRIIEHFISMGYSFAPIDRSTPVCHHEILN